MSTIEDFENAPVGATATSPDGRRMYRRGTEALAGADWVCGEGDGRLWANAVGLAHFGYTLDPAPAPDPKPDWLDAPAVLAECDCSPGEQTVYVNYSEIAWTCTDCDNPINPEDMKNVTPLYPKDKKHE